MSERLSEDQLAAFIGGTTPLPGEVVRMSTELRARRAADLTAAEREGLGRLLDEVTTWPQMRHHFKSHHAVALAALARVLGGGE